MLFPPRGTVPLSVLTYFLFVWVYSPQGDDKTVCLATITKAERVFWQLSLEMRLVFVAFNQM